MTVPSTNISLTSIQNEFGGPSPVVLSNYYRGGAYVRNTSTTANIPTSGTISLGNFAGAKAEGDGPECLTNFWNNRGSLFRNCYAQSSYPGDVQIINNPYQRYTNPSTVSYGFSNAGLPTVSGSMTLVFMIFGHGVTGFNATTSSPSIYENHYTYAANPVGLALRYVNASTADITSAYISFVRSTANRGAWTALMVLPGLWSVSQNIYDWGPGSRTLPAGRVSILLSEKGDSDGPDMPAYSGWGSIRGNYYWYNNGNYVVGFNPTTSDITESIYGSNLFYGRRNLFELYKTS